MGLHIRNGIRYGGTVNYATNIVHRDKTVADYLDDMPNEKTYAEFMAMTKEEQDSGDYYVTDWPDEFAEAENIPYGETTVGAELDALNSNLTQLADYSTNEVAIGKWINGKTIYRRVITFNTASGATIVGSIPNVEDLINVHGVGYDNYGTVLPIPYVNVTYINLQTTVFLKNDTKEIVVQCGSGLNYEKGFVVVEYTKA